MLADSQYDIKINGGGYILIEESYRKQPQQPFSPRFATGDPGLGDLSFWQFLGMEGFDGGEGQDIFSELTRIKGSVGWDFRDGKPRLSQSYRTDGWTTNALAAVKTQATTNNHLRQYVRTHNAVPATTFSLAVTPGDDANEFTTRAIGTYEAWVKQTGYYSATLWSRPQLGTFIVSALSDQLHYFAAGRIDTASPNTYSGNVVVSSGSPTIVNIVPVSGNACVIIESSPAGSGYTTIRLVTFTVNTWTVATNYACTLPYTNPLISGCHAFDSSGTLYLVTTPQNFAAAGNYATLGSEVLTFSAADLVHADGVRLTNRYPMPGFIATGLLTNAGKVYVLGTQRKTASVQQAQIVDSTSGAVVWESAYSTVLTNHDGLPLAYFQDNPLEAFFIARNALGNYDSILRFKGGIVSEAAAIPRAATGTTENKLLSFAANRFYWYDAAAGLMRSTADTRGALDSSGTSAILEFSEFGGNTPLITKTPYSVTVELSEPLTGSDTMAVVLGGTTIGTLTSADTTGQKTITISADLSATGFDLQLVVPRAVTWAGYLKRIYVRYIPTQFKKKQWAFGIRMTNGLKLADGSRENTTPTAMFAAIEAAWSSNTPVTLTDIDGVDYTVIITSFDIRHPLLPRDKWKREGLCFVEALEV